MIDPFLIISKFNWKVKFFIAVLFTEFQSNLLLLYQYITTTPLIQLFIFFNARCNFLIEFSQENIKMVADCSKDVKMVAQKRWWLYTIEKFCSGQNCIKVLSKIVTLDYVVQIERTFHGSSCAYGWCIPWWWPQSKPSCHPSLNL